MTFELIFNTSFNKLSPAKPVMYLCPQSTLIVFIDTLWLFLAGAADLLFFLYFLGVFFLDELDSETLADEVLRYGEGGDS